MFGSARLECNDFLKLAESCLGRCLALHQKDDISGKTYNMYFAFQYQDLVN